MAKDNKNNIEKKKTSTGKSKTVRVSKTVAEGGKNLNSTNMILTGLFIVAIGIGCTLMVRAVMPVWYLELAAVVVGGLGWFLAVIGSSRTRNLNRSYKSILVWSIIGLAAKIIEAGIGFMNHLAGFGELAFIEIEASFFAFGSIVTMLIAFNQIAFGVKGVSNSVPSKKWNGVMARTAIVTMIAVIVAPLGSMFGGIVEIAIAAGAAVLLLIVVGSTWNVLSNTLKAETSKNKKTVKEEKAN